MMLPTIETAATLTLACFFPFACPSLIDILGQMNSAIGSLGFLDVWNTHLFAKLWHSAEHHIILKYQCEFCIFSLIKGKTGKTGFDGVPGPKGSQVKYYFYSCSIVLFLFNLSKKICLINYFVCIQWIQGEPGTNGRPGTDGLQVFNNISIFSFWAYIFLILTSNLVNFWLFLHFLIIVIKVFSDMHEHITHKRK